MKRIVPTVVWLLLMGGISCVKNSKEKERTCGGVIVDYPPEPSIPRAHSPPDPASYKPLQILYVPLNIDEENWPFFQEAFNYANGKLSKILKSPRLKEIRLPRVFNETTGSCDSPKCSHQEIPGQYALPCYDKNSQLVPEKEVSVDDQVQEYNQGQYSLVIYVMLEPRDPATTPDDDEYNGDDEYKRPRCTNYIAHATICRHGDNLRPTHGSITFCSRSNELHKQRLLDTFLHETFHVLLMQLDGSLIPLGQSEDMYGESKAVENITWKHVTREWTFMASNEQEHTLKIPMTITDNVVEFVRDHFNCSSVEGAELELFLYMKNLSVTTNAVHWSLRLFNDDILAFFSTSARRITNLTLSFAKDTTWYDVDMSMAEPLDISKPQERGCDVATKSSHQVLNSSYADRTKVHLVRPFCDLKMNVITPLCSHDGMWRLECIEYSFWTLYCAIAHGASYPDKDPDIPFDHPKCSLATSQPNMTAKYGLKVGTGTMCITFINSPWDEEVRLMAACVAYECLQGTLILKFETNDVQCKIPLPPGQFDNMIANFTFDNGTQCQELFSSLTFIGPEVKVICPYTSTSTQITTTAVRRIPTSTKTTSSTKIPLTSSGYKTIHEPLTGWLGVFCLWH